MLSGPLELIFIALIGAAVCWITYRSFMNPRGVFSRSLAGFGIAFGAIIAAAFCASPFLSDAAGLGIFLIICALTVLAAAVALLAIIAASLRHVFDAAGRG